LTPEAIARAVLYAVSQPDDVDVNEVIVRTLRQMSSASDDIIKPSSRSGSTAGRNTETDASNRHEKLEHV